MRLPSIADRIGERFVRPLLVDRLRSLVRQSVAPIPRAKHRRAFAQLLRELEPLASEPSGVGFEVPDWLAALEEELDAMRSGSQRDPALDMQQQIPQIRLSRSQARRQVHALHES